MAYTYSERQNGWGDYQSTGLPPEFLDPKSLQLGSVYKYPTYELVLPNGKNTCCWVIAHVHLYVTVIFKKIRRFFAENL
jgi:hypothetical protein